MVQKVKTAIISSKEFFFQVILHCLVFSFYVIDNNHPDTAIRIEPYQFVFFLNYTLANALISYYLLPQFYYRKKHGYFFVFTLMTVGMVILLEEFVLEKAFFPDSRGASFPGILFTLAQVLPIITILSGFKFAWDALTKQRQVDELKAMIKESELEFLKSQINPHFLFNNLNNLYAYAIENSPKTPTIILELSSVLRYMLYECREKSVPLSKEIEHLKNFSQLYELQIEDRGTIRFHAPEMTSYYRIAPLILIVFIENAFKHSQASQSGDIFIDINMHLSDNGTLHFQCTNNFQPVNHAIHTTTGGIGLENVQKRLQLLYADAHHLDIRQSNDQYHVDLTMQLNKTL